MLVRIVLAFLTFFSGIILQGLQLIINPLTQIVQFVHDTAAFLFTEVPAFTLAWGWVRWAIPNDVWALIAILLSIEAAAMSFGLIMSAFKIVKAWIPFL